MQNGLRDEPRQYQTQFTLCTLISTNEKMMRNLTWAPDLHIRTSDGEMFKYAQPKTQFNDIASYCGLYNSLRSVGANV